MQRSNNSFWLVVIGSVGCWTLAGCAPGFGIGGGQPATGTEAMTASAAANVVTSQAGIAQLIDAVEQGLPASGGGSDGGGGGGDLGEQARGNFGDAASALGSDAGGCVSLAETGAGLEIRFDNCAFNSGALLVDGSLLWAGEIVEQNGLVAHVTFSSPGLTVQGTTFAGSIDHTVHVSRPTASATLDSLFDIQLSGAEGTYDAAGALNGVVTQGPCIAADADFEQTLSGASVTTSLVGYQQCAGACPAAGVLTMVDEAGITSTLTFDGTATPELVVGGVVRGTISLPCGNVEQ